MKRMSKKELTDNLTQTGGIRRLKLEYKTQMQFALLERIEELKESIKILKGNTFAKVSLTKCQKLLRLIRTNNLFVEV